MAFLCWAMFVEFKDANFEPDRFSDWLDGKNDGF